jgi:hypothetical protein
MLGGRHRGVAWVGHDGGVEELILRTVVIQFDGRVVEVFGNHSNEVMRAHVALMKEPQIAVGPNRKGRRLVSVGATSIGVDEDEWERLAPLIERIREAVQEARNAAQA